MLPIATLGSRASVETVRMFAVGAASITGATAVGASIFGWVMFGTAFGVMVGPLPWNMLGAPFGVPKFGVPFGAPPNAGAFIEGAFIVAPLVGRPCGAAKFAPWGRPPACGPKLACGPVGPNCEPPCGMKFAWG